MIAIKFFMVFYCHVCLYFLKNPTFRNLNGFEIINMWRKDFLENVLISWYYTFRIPYF